jgi:hypothetical protein
MAELIRLGREHLAVDARLPLGREHARDLVEREAGGAPQRDQRQPLQHAGIEQAAQPAPAGGGDQPLFVIEAQRRCRNAGLLRHLGDVQMSHPLDLKST